MLTNRQLFLQHVAQTSPEPLMLEIVKAEGATLTDTSGKTYTDLISGIAVSNLGHRHPAVVAAIKNQVDQYLHLMVYGEYIQSPQVQLAKSLTELLPESLNSVYFVNSGAEAVEGALKLAKRYTGRSEIVSFKNAYHGSTHGALSLMSDEYFKQPFRPLLPGVKFLEFNLRDGLKNITDRTACVVVEIIQGEAGAIPADPDFIEELKAQCKKTGTLMIADEIQTGFGRTGTFFAFEQYQLIPDILLLAKGMGGGMPIGAFISSRSIMNSLTLNPVLGHITTFGGHPVSCAASLATLKEILHTDFATNAKNVESNCRNILKHKCIKGISGRGLMLGVEFESAAINQQVIKKCIGKGVITDWFLFAPHKMRIAPPLVISEDLLIASLNIILESIDEAVN